LVSEWRLLKVLSASSSLDGPVQAGTSDQSWNRTMTRMTRMTRMKQWSPENVERLAHQRKQEPMLQIWLFEHDVQIQFSLTLLFLISWLMNFLECLPSFAVSPQRQNLL
jgi:hypothetical protein